ncbi:MAG: SCO family protein [Melioribacteraceae bacterium]
MKNKTVTFPLLLLLLLLSFCKAELEELDDFNSKYYSLLNQDSTVVEFPTLLEGNVGVVGYIFTNCPDICPLTTNNMRLIQKQLSEENIKGVKFVSISFDTDTDKPSVLKDFAEVRNLDLTNWEFLTGKEQTIKELMKQVGVVAFVGDSTVFDDGRKSYYFVHTDRIQLIDKNGILRKNYIGSKIKIEEIIADIKTLTED